MLVKEHMSHPVITVHPETLMQEALNLMRTKRIRAQAPEIDEQIRSFNRDTGLLGTL